MPDFDPTDLLPGALLLMQVAFFVCFVLWWVLRKLHSAGEPVRAQVNQQDASDADEGVAAAAPDRRPRQRPARAAGADQASTSGQPGGARPRRWTSPPAARSKAPDDTRKREHAPSPQSHPPDPTARRHSETQRSASTVSSVAPNDSRRRTIRDGPRPADPAGAMETAVREDPGAASAAPLGTPPRRAEAPSRAAGQAGRGLQPHSQPTATLRMPAVGPPVLNRADDSHGGDDNRFVMRPQPRATSDDIEANFQALNSAVNAEYELRFLARQREGWNQNPSDPLDPVANPTPSALRAQRIRARMAIMQKFSPRQDTGEH